MILQNTGPAKIAGLEAQFLRVSIYTEYLDISSEEEISIEGRKRLFYKPDNVFWLFNKGLRSISRISWLIRFKVFLFCPYQ